MTTPAPLQYGPRPPLAWASRHRGKLILLAVILSLGGGIYAWWKPLSLRARWIYWSHRCATYQMPAERDVHEVSPSAVPTGPDYIFSMSSAGARVTFSPLPLRKLAEIDPRVAGSGDVLFLGTLHRPDGAARTVSIISMCDNAYALLFGMYVSVLNSPGWFDRIPTGTAMLGLAWSGPWMPVMYRTAACDPADPTHLVIHFRATPVTRLDAKTQPNPIPGQIDVYLQNDDTMRFKLRNTPELSEARIGLGFSQTGNALEQTKSSIAVWQR